MRLVRGEIKKIFKKPGIFIITLLLLVVLAFSCLIYSPEIPTNLQVVYQNKTTVSEVISYFTDSSSVNSKQSFDAYITSANQKVDFYENYTSQKAILNSKLTLIVNSFYDYKNTYISSGDAPATITKRNLVKTYITDYLSSYTTITASSTTPSVLVKTIDKSNTIQLLNNALSVFNVTTSGIDVHQYTFDNFQGNNYINKLTTYTNAILDFTVNSSQIEAIKQIINATKNDQNIDKLTTISDQIDYYKTAYGSSNYAYNLNAAYQLISKYKFTAKLALDITTNAIYRNGLSVVDEKNINLYVGFSDSNIYTINENLSKYDYMFSTNTTVLDYGNNFNFSTTSSSVVSMYDYSFFALKICMLIVIIYIIGLGANSIAGEFSSGTIKMLAIRPFTRRKILTAKIAACLIVGLILTVVCYSTTLIIGAIMFGTSNIPILSVFNSATTFVVSPLIMSLISLACAFFELMFYCLVAIAISTIFKNSVASITTSFLLYFSTFIVSFIPTSSIYFLNFVPLLNLNTFKYFGSAINPSDTSVFDLIFSPTVFNAANFWSSLIVIGFSVTIMLILAYTLFKRRDIK